MAQAVLLSNAAFLRLWISNTASGLATWALPFVLALTIVADELSAAYVGLALAARTFGFILAMPVGGVLADRSGPRRMISGAGVLAALGILPIVAGVSTFVGVGFVIIGACLTGFGQGACRASYQAIIPRVVSGDQRQAANAAMTISIRVSTLVGPSLATVSVLYVGTSITFLMIAALWSLAALLPANRPQTPDTSVHRPLTLSLFISELGDGFSEVRSHPWIVAGLAALSLVITFGYSVTNVLLPQVSKAHFGGPELLAVSVTTYTLGALAGALVIARWKPKNIGWIALSGLALYGLVPLSLIQPSHMILPIAAFFIAGVGIELFNVPWFTAMQREVPAERLARVSSVDFLFSYGLAPLGLAGLTPLTQAIGIIPVLLICAVICFGAPFIAMIVPSSRGFSRV
ncbi:MFS transporter [Pacificibacter marinus]|uniref:MFS transporter n=1 Tax=Pacificibacter marinus TaxID=658057 RepID=UPI001C06BF67|nr:MFS transporter [Pacificibacter marinus]MBU2867903.1 MFS transporter [Pacificibacter marinus]